MFHFFSRALTACAVGLLIIVAASQLAAQPPAGLEVIAVAGEPFGVGQISVVAPPGVQLTVTGSDGFSLVERNGRVLYPAFGKEPVRGVLRNLLNRPQRSTAWFLFQGPEPLELEFPGAPGNRPLVVRPVRDRGLHEGLLSDWWREYSGAQRLPALIAGEADEAPPYVKNYLTAMLARRLDLRLPPARGPWLEEPALDQTLGLTLGTEALRLAMVREAFSHGNREREDANQAVPKMLVTPVSNLPALPDNVAVEPLSLHVPEECFYLRFGSYGNFLWLRNFISQAGGDLRNLINARGLNYDMNLRFERQLLIRSSVLGDLLGDVVIADVALIGADTFFREGAAVGLLFQARNNELLANDISQQRRAALANNPLITERQLEIASRNVSLLSTPDNAVRSFYAVDGDFHLVTTSQAIVRRFFEAGQGERALGSSEEFRHARTAMPLARQDTIFLYVSSACLANLVSPQYRLEMTRQVQAASEIEMLQLARLAARAEGRPAETTEQLIKGGFLPAKFGHRHDGSRTVVENGATFDSLRGARGSFLPVSDMELTAATPSEVASYQELMSYIGENVYRLDPIMAGIKRIPPLKGHTTERVVMDVRLSPLAEKHYDFLARWLSGPPDRQQLAPMPGDLVSVEAIIGGQHLFAGLRDCNPLGFLPGSQRGLPEAIVRLLQSPPLENVLVYVGATNRRALDFLGDFRFSQPDRFGYARSDGPFWRWQNDPYVVLSFHRHVLEAVTPRLEFVEAERPAQARLTINDLRQSEMAGFLTALGTRRAASASQGNARLLNSLVQQLHVPEEEALATAQSLLDARLVCPLGGEYVLASGGATTPRLVSTAWADLNANGRQQRPGAYRLQFLDWFRGLQADCRLEEGSLVAHIEIDMTPLQVNGVRDK